MVVSQINVPQEAHSTCQKQIKANAWKFLLFHSNNKQKSKKKKTGIVIVLKTSQKCYCDGFENLFPTKC